MPRNIIWNIILGSPCKLILSDSVICSESLGIKSWWPQARFAVFIAVNTSLIAIIYVLFRSAGIIGSHNNTEKDYDYDVMDAELAD